MSKRCAAAWEDALADLIPHCKCDNSPAKSRRCHPKYALHHGSELGSAVWPKADPFVQPVQHTLPSGVAPGEESGEAVNQFTEVDERLECADLNAEERLKTCQSKPFRARSLSAVPRC